MDSGLYNRALGLGAAQLRQELDLLQQRHRPHLSREAGTVTRADSDASTGFPTA